MQNQPPPGLPSQIIPTEPGQYSPSNDERTMGMVIHLLLILTGFLGPLILWLVKKDESGFINHHGKEAINYLITHFIVSLVLIALSIVTLGLGALLFFPYGIALLILEIIACISAYQGKWYRYPLTIRLIK